MSVDDILFLPFADLLPGTVLFTGFHGDKFWDIWVPPSSDAKRGDVSGSSLGEFRLRLGFVHLPIPFIFIRWQESIRQVGRSDAMKPFRKGGWYDRPVPRRIAEEAGVPRQFFGQKKMAACIVSNGLDGPFLRSLPKIMTRYRPGN